MPSQPCAQNSNRWLGVISKYPQLCIKMIYINAIATLHHANTLLKHSKGMSNEGTSKGKHHGVVNTSLKEKQLVRVFSPRFNQHAKSSKILLHQLDLGECA
jgi:hypothetical protein